MSRASTRAKLAELKALRKAGKKAFDTYEVEDADAIYDEVDDDGYKKLVWERLNEDDFVVDDNGEGYADDGREEWDRVRREEEEEDSEDEAPARGRPSKGEKKKAKEEQARRDANDRSISEFFSNKGAVAKAAAKSKVVRTQEDSDFLADLLGEVDANAPPPRPTSILKSEKGSIRRKARALSPAHEPSNNKKQKRVNIRLPSPEPFRFESAANDHDENIMMENDDGGLPPLDVDDGPADILMSDPAPSSPAAKVALRKGLVQKEPQSDMINDDDDDDDDDDEAMELAYASTVKTPSVNLTASRVIRKPIKQEPENPIPPTSSPQRAPDPAVDPSSWNELTEKLNVVSSSQPETHKGIGKIDHQDALEPDGSLNFFWLDYTEVNGSLCLFGKVQNKKTKSFVSCFLKIDNILRKLYFLPRKQRVQDGAETDDTVDMMDVYNEVDEIMTKMKVGMYKIKQCTRKYAFELLDIPREAQYMKLLYPYTSPQMNMDASGQTFSHVFGTNTALFEQFVLWKNIMGPCWLKIKDADYTQIKNASHCKLEVLAEHPDMVSVLTDSENNNLDAPPLTLMSLALRTAFNAKENKQEILAMSARIYEKLSLSDTTPADKLPCRTFTVIRPHGQSFPLGFDSLAKSRKRGIIVMRKQEQEVLSYFLAQMDIADPDVLMGHQLEGVDYSVLLNRLHEKKVHQWSRLGRLRRSQWPASLSKVGGNVFAERQVIAGRLLCDLANDAGKSAMFKCQTWSLTEMCSLYLTGDNRRREIDNEAALNTWAKESKGLMDYVTHMEADTHYIAALAVSVQLLPLTKVLTNLAGNSWARTLTGTRAERNEYILLHEFHRGKYICPDKQQKQTFRGRQHNKAAAAEEEQQQQQRQQRPNDEESAAAGEGSNKKKNQYKGGLVFEPEKGLYDKFVLVMDFNSLYPSIIQEYNICFTTVDRSSSVEDQDAVPEVPVGQEQGILPRLIATLVGRRRQVKSLMKDKRATPEQLATWDIKQLALKLTANSMYGCLGYDRSRFYARPLAILTTSKGREILRSTKDLAESKSLQVIYGDTDSVMINANVDNIADALRVGNEFKRAVNDQYKLLEIDIDNVFRRILLQAKKRYAAVNLVEKDGKYIEQLEVKGLDMKRREYCALSKEVSKHLLDEILSGDDAEVSVARIHEYLTDIAAKMRAFTIPVPKYIIYTQLGKAPSEYPNADSMPQVQVALREQARKKIVRKGDVIAYVITGSSKDSSSEPAPKRAFAPADLKADPEHLRPDIEWYISKQIFPPVERLCANIAGTSTPQLAECLGLDIRRYTASSHSSSSNAVAANDLDLHPLESQIPDDVRFSDCQRLTLRCRKCHATSPFEGLIASHDRVSAAGILCPTCNSCLSTLSIVAQVEHAVRSQTTRYYEGWLICDDSQCANRTRQMSVYGTCCLGPRGLARDCTGRMRYEYTEKSMYNQLVYFAGLWDVDKARSRAGELPDREREKVLALAEHNRTRFGTVKGVVDRYLDKCGRQWVAMDSLFAKLGFLKAG